MRPVLSLVLLSMVVGCGQSHEGPLVCVGDATITSSAEWDVFVAHGCASVTGSLTIRGGVTSVDLPSLASVGGALAVYEDPTLTSLSLPGLMAVGSLYVYSSPTLAGIDLPALTTVGGQVMIYANPALTSLDLPALAVVGGDLCVAYNHLLPECRVLALKDHLVAVHGYAGAWHVVGNDTTATCP
jgi:hypothetical protein